MSTDGAYGFKKNGEYKVTMCGSSSYYEWLGQNVIDFIRETGDIEILNQIYDKIIMIDVNDDYDPDEDEVYISNTNIKLSPQQYEVIKEELDCTEGYLNYYLKDDSKYMIDNEGFMEWGFCEYTYVIDLDKNILMVQKGEKGEEGCEIRHIDLDYIFKNNIDLDKYMQNIQETNQEQLKLENLVELVEECVRRNLPLDTPVFISDDRGMNRIHIGGFAQIINKNNEKDNDYFKAICENNSNAKTKDINILIYKTR